MAVYKVPIRIIESSSLNLFLIKRSYSIAAAATVLVKKVDHTAHHRTSDSSVVRDDNTNNNVGHEDGGKKKKGARGVFWMKDPKSGNWIPETHLGQTDEDVADLRLKLLPKNKTKTN